MLTFRWPRRRWPRESRPRSVPLHHELKCIWKLTPVWRCGPLWDTARQRHKAESRGGMCAAEISTDPCGPRTSCWLQREPPQWEHLTRGMLHLSYSSSLVLTTGDKRGRVDGQELELFRDHLPRWKFIVGLCWCLSSEILCCWLNVVKVSTQTSCTGNEKLPDMKTN